MECIGRYTMLSSQADEATTGGGGGGGKKNKRGGKKKKKNQGGGSKLKQIFRCFFAVISHMMSFLGPQTSSTIPLGLDPKNHRTAVSKVTVTCTANTARLSLHRYQSHNCSLMANSLKGRYRNTLGISIPSG